MRMNVTAAAAMIAVGSLGGATAAPAADGPPSPDYLKAEFTLERVLDWGERPVWSPDGRKIAFTRSDVEDGPAYELDLQTRAVRCLTCRWGVNGYVTRIYYLPDGSFLIEAGPDLETTTSEEDEGTGAGAASTALYWLPASAAIPPRSLQVKAMGEIAINPKPLKDGSVELAWGQLHGTASKLVTGDLVRDGSAAMVTNRRVRYANPPGMPNSPATFVETYDFADDGQSVTFWSIKKGQLASGMFKLGLNGGGLTELPDDDAHNETHLFPDERYGLEESNRASDPSGPMRGISSSPASAMAVLIPRDFPGDREDAVRRNSGHAFDLFARSYSDGRTRRLTHVSDIGGEAHQSSPAPDGRRIVFAMKSPKSGPFAGKQGLYIGTFASTPGKTGN